METSVIISIIFLVALALVSALAPAIIASRKDNEIRWKNIMEEMNRRYPKANYKAKVEFIRRDRYAAIKLSTELNQDITELMEDYQLILDEQKRIEEEENQLGSEFEPYVASQTEERI